MGIVFLNRIVKESKKISFIFFRMLLTLMLLFIPALLEFIMKRYFIFYLSGVASYLPSESTKYFISYFSKCINSCDWLLYLLKYQSQKGNQNFYFSLR